MTTVLGLACVVFGVVCGVMMVVCKRTKRFEDRASSDRTACDETVRVSKRDAHYMRNFWSYDGSEQQDWDE